jgi:hypothetical protein
MSMKFSGFLLSTAAVMAAFLPQAIQAKLAPLVKTDVTGAMPINVQEAEKRCKAMPTILEKKVASRIFWQATVACLATEILGGQDNSSANILVQTGTDPKIHVLQLQKKTMEKFFLLLDLQMQLLVMIKDFLKTMEKNIPTQRPRGYFPLGRCIVIYRQIMQRTLDL